MAFPRPHYCKNQIYLDVLVGLTVRDLLKVITLFAALLLSSGVVLGANAEQCREALKQEDCCRSIVGERAVPIPSARIVDPLKLADWVARHPPGEAQNVAKALSKIITKKSRISRTQFENSLFSMGKKLESQFLEAYGKGPFSVVLLHDGNAKSSHWVAHYMQSIGALPKDIGIAAEVNFKDLPTLLPQYKNFPHILVDDAAYSGLQLSTLMNYFEITRKNLEDGSARLFVGSAFISDFALEQLGDFYQEIHLVYGEILPTVFDDISQMNFPNKRHLTEAFSKMYSGTHTSYLRYFDHKIPDSFSTLGTWNSTLFDNGLVVDQNGNFVADSSGEPSLQFLDKLPPPYKIRSN